MMSTPHLLLSRTEVLHKIERIAYQIAEENAYAEEIALAGIKNRGLFLAQRLAVWLDHIGGPKAVVGHIRMNKQNPVHDAITTNLNPDAWIHKPVVIVDDVANTGRTLLYACKPFMEQVHVKIQVAVLIDRRHKTHPVSPDFYGTALSTTLQEHVTVVLTEGEEAVYLS
jgi:pyrimidine operon attenuation protein/uracil phosphoribosyltransferase